MKLGFQMSLWVVNRALENNIPVPFIVLINNDIKQ